MTLKQIIIRNITILFAVSVFLALFISAQSVQRVSAAEPGCYIEDQISGDVRSSGCGGDSSLLLDVSERSQCFLAPQVGLSGNVGEYNAVSCNSIDFEEDSESTNAPTTGGSTSASSQARPGSLSNNCLTNPENPGCEQVNTNEFEGEHQCGKGPDQITTSISFGCRGDSWPGESVNPIVDMAFALFRVLSYGVGLVVIGSIVYAGIMYSAARGNPQMTEASMKRVAASFGALLLYIFSFAIGNFLVPGGLFI